MTIGASAAPQPTTRPAEPSGTPESLAQARLDWVSQLPSASAPGFVYLAGACRGVPVGGGGSEMAEAAGRLAGETAEVLAQAAEPVATALPGDPAIDTLWTTFAVPLRVAAVAIVSSAAVGVPAASIFRGGRAEAERASQAPPASLGLAAGPDRESARLAAVLELVERDAAARWWYEDARACQLDLALVASVASDLSSLRRGAAWPRRTVFLELGSATGLPVVCALSCDADGRGLAFGFKAAVDRVVAARGALMELLQMEIGLELARLRVARGGPAEGDRGPLARAALAPEHFPAFAALPPASTPMPVAPGFAAVAAHLACRGLPVTVADLPRSPVGLAVAKAFMPGLRPLPGPGPVEEGAPGAVAPLM